MGIRTIPFDVLTPGGTLIASPQSTPLGLEDAKLNEVRVIIPDGHCGLTGIRLLQSGQQIFPWSNLHYLIGNNRVISFPYTGEITVSGLVAVTYNLDTFNHTHYLEIVIEDITARNVAVSNGQSAPVILPGSTAPSLDPLSPDALIASLPDNAELPDDMTDQVA